VSRNKKIFISALVVIVLVGVGTTFIAMSGGSTTANNPVVVLTKVQTRTMQDTVPLTGTLARKEIRKVDAASQGLISAVETSNGKTANVGDTLFALNGRDAIAEPGALPFFRSLAPGDDGDDVLELKHILAAAGDYPGPMNTLFTEQTQFALAQWQAQHGYPNATPATQQAVTVSLAQGPGYKIGNEDSAGLVIGPPPGRTTAAVTHHHGAAEATLVSARVEPHIPSPVLEIQSVDAQIAQGQPAAFVISASTAPSTNLTVNLSSGGTAGSSGVVTPPTSAVLQAGATSTQVAVQTRATNIVGPDTTISLSLQSGSGYTVGAQGSAQTTITDPTVPTVQISGGTSVKPGGAVTLTVTADQAPVVQTRVALSFAGSAVPGSDYTPPNPVVVLGPGQTSANVTVDTLKSNELGPNRYLVAAISPSPGTYNVGTQDNTVVTITGSTGVPTLTLTSATTYLAKGQPYQVTLGLSEAVSTPVTVNLTYSGSAQQGTDFTAPSGSIVIPPGQTSLPVAIPTVVDDVVEPDRVLTVSLAAGTGYQVGSPSSASATITSSVVPQLTITADTSSVTEGGAATFTITADQAPAKDTSVNYQVVGTAQPGQDYDAVTGTALLKAGQTKVTVTLRTLQSDITFAPTDMIVGSWPTRIGTVYVKAGGPVAPGAPILSLTEPDLTVTLDASASSRTKLAVGQHCTVQISGGVTQYPGTITELDASPTVVGQSQQFEGRISVSGLDAVDGTSVSISVVDQQIDNALTVPIAAVKQNGAGQDVVRVMDLHQGQIHEVPVTTGLTEGSYIQITKGLQEGDTVVVEVDQSK
jgi:hypothetical protein